MHCHICDAVLSDNEIRFEKDFNDYAPCSRCIEASGVGVQSTDEAANFLNETNYLETIDDATDQTEAD